MNRPITLIVCVCICLSTALLSCYRSHQTNKVLLILREDNSPPIEFMLTLELVPMKQMLEKEGFEVAVATLTGEPISSKTINVQLNIKLTEVNVDDYCGIIIPCMGLSALFSEPKAVDIVKRAAAQGKPVAAQYGAIIELAKAGVLKQKKYAYFAEPPRYDEGFRGGIYAGRGVVQDGNIITSGVCPWVVKGTGLPDQTSKLTQAFIAELKRRK